MRDVQSLPSLQTVTAAHSQRLSALHQRRDAALGDALAARDSELRALPAAASLYAKFDKAVAAAFDDRVETEHKAAAARASALARSSETRSESLAEAQAKRKAADLEALDRKMHAEAAAEKRFREALSTLASTTSLETRQKTTRDADRARQRELEDAREAYAAAITAGQTTYRKATDAALLDERASERAAEHAFTAARRVAAASESAARAAAERELFRGLQSIVAAREALDRYRATVTRLRADAMKDEQALFDQFRNELRRAS